MKPYKQFKRELEEAVNLRKLAAVFMMGCASHGCSTPPKLNPGEHFIKGQKWVVDGTQKAWTGPIVWKKLPLDQRIGLCNLHNRKNPEKVTCSLGDGLVISPYDEEEAKRMLAWGDEESIYDHEVRHHRGEPHLGPYRLIHPHDNKK